MNAEIIAIGSELLTPFRQDTNSLFLTDRLNTLGIEVDFKSVVGDDREHLVNAARIAFGRADVILFMGGLGPTEDDLTRECVAEALGIELRRDPGLTGDLYKWFAGRRLKMPESNLKQADVLAGAVSLPNANGTAPGQWLETEWADRKLVIALLPGPPREIKPLFDEQVMPRLRAIAPGEVIATRVLKVAMMGESACDELAAKVYKKYRDIQTTILGGAGEVQLHLRGRAKTLELAKAKVDRLADELEDALDPHLFSSAGESLEQIVGYYLDMRGVTIATAESCTGGLVAERLTAVAGSSRYFLGGVIAYSNDLKTGFVDIQPLLIKEHGAVSREIAVALAEGIRKRCGAQLGVGVTGIAGPGGGSEEKPVGLVYCALADGKKTEVVQKNFPGDRERVRWFASQQALDMVRRKLSA
ncbi:MAG: competence/damage-inducible protein A [Candidatus Koribacter versatilis]|uniref:CinA-like protein n=1 Tax=Candidatus Korobacter versatilis TaxID=658062 RepID=A0A932A631_9BACT|nr:competence/damage-inducible protein A [Candidatus Koribacter versatilis]